MSAAIKCDRCGAFYELEDAGGYLKLTGRVETKGDLCEECSTELRAWFRAPKKDKEGR